MWYCKAYIALNYNGDYKDLEREWKQKGSNNSSDIQISSQNTTNALVEDPEEPEGPPIAIIAGSVLFVVISFIIYLKRCKPSKKQQPQLQIDIENNFDEFTNSKVDNTMK